MERATSERLTDASPRSIDILRFVLRLTSGVSRHDKSCLRLPEEARHACARGWRRADTDFRSNWATVLPCKTRTSASGVGTQKSISLCRPLGGLLNVDEDIAKNTPPPSPPKKKNCFSLMKIWIYHRCVSILNV